MAPHLQVTVIVRGGTPRPIELGASALVGSGRAADLRIPDPSLAPLHLRLLRDGDGVLAIALAAGVSLDGVELAVDDVVSVAGRTLDVGPVRLVAAPWHRGAEASRVRTDSLARELVRDLLAGEGGDPADLAPELVVEAGPATGQRLALPPPVARLVIGRGNTSDWILLDPDLSRSHATVVRDVDGVRIHDLGSKNQTLVDGAVAPREPPGLLLGDGATVTLGDTVIRFRDPAAALLADLERRLAAPAAVHAADTVTHPSRPRPDPRAAAPSAAATRAPPGPAPRWAIAAAAALAVAAVALLVALLVAG